MWKKLFLSLVFIFHIPTPVMGVATCTGTICTSLPPEYLRQLNQLDLQFRVQYLDELLVSMGRASAMANIGTGLIGLGSINKYQVGLGGTASFLTNKSISVAYQDTAIRRLPNIGFAVSPGITAGVNLGWLLEKGGGHDVFRKEWEEDEEDDEENDEEEIQSTPTLLHRFTIYMHGMSLNSGLNDYKMIQPKNYGVEGDISMSQYGLNIRYLILPPGIDHGVYRFMGINLGIGYHRLKNEISVTSTKDGNSEFRLGPYLGAWVGDTKLDYDLTTVSIPVDFRTGIQIFGGFTFFLGAGFAKHDIDGSVSLQRGGPLRLSLDPDFAYTANTLTPIQFQTLQEAVKQEGYLDIRMQSQEKFGFSNGYGILGFEFEIAGFQFMGEAILFGKAGSGSLGFKLNF
jgi:hypothetical protein